VRCIEPIGHAAILEGLWSAARARRLGHALCFVGPSGSGKFLAAERLAMGLLCARGPGSPCGECGACKRAKIDSHPDVFVVEVDPEESEWITIDRVASRQGGDVPSIETFLSLRPMEGGWRVVLVREADRLVEQAQNALLKTLEEPGESTLLVLETARPDRLLPTIHSRCVRVPFASLGCAEVERVLAQNGVPPKEIAQLARWGAGAPGFALALAARGGREMRAQIEAAIDGTSEPFAIAAEVAELEGDFPGKTAAARGRSRARTFQDLAIAVLTDAIRHANGIAPESLAHGDLALRFAGVPESVLLSSLERILQARQDVEHNLSPDAAIDRALLAFPKARKHRVGTNS